ncbi:hypothetical protein EVC45_22575 [Paraburkholderia sp. UYCP14C]|uniref:hypothetical protein n=1 Tax=Paraburkholderia sp. UYCP14C TaxID=2511130 RepID=UPI00102257FF|nr:hypothetical protein [Paraburkholderia sp. UYCP14C]RZF27373.1 hypothetical protein EVC45_22575 [Paraburkholderia sp. UYCP14C]
MKVKVVVAISITIAVSLSLWVMYIGYFESYIDHDQHQVYFVKKFPTFQREFVNPFANEGDDKQIDELSPYIRRSFADYCKYAYGITHSDTKSLEHCKAQILREVQ